MKDTEELNTEQNQINSNDISFENVYSAIRHLKPEYQGIILAQYKLFDLYSLFKDGKEFDRYLAGLINSATEYLKLSSALIALYKEAIKECNEAREFDIVDYMSQCFDKLPESDKKRVCGAMMGKKEFFSDAYRIMMDVFGNVLEKKEGSGNIVGGE